MKKIQFDRELNQKKVFLILQFLKHEKLYKNILWLMGKNISFLLFYVMLQKM